MNKMVLKETKVNPDQWLNNHLDYLTRYARKRIWDEEKIKDLIQETFIAALRSLENFKQNSTERTWLTSILKHKIVDHYRKRNTQQGRTERFMVSHEEFFEHHFVEAAITQHTKTEMEIDEDQRILAQKVQACLDRLPKQQAKVFEMKYLKEYDTETICQKMNMSRNGVWVSVSRAKKTLAADFGTYKDAI